MTRTLDPFASTEEAEIAAEALNDIVVSDEAVICEIDNPEPNYLLFLITRMKLSIKLASQQMATRSLSKRSCILWLSKMANTRRQDSFTQHLDQ